MKLSPAQLLALRWLDTAVKEGGNEFYGKHVNYNGWAFPRISNGYLRRNTWDSLIRLGLVEELDDMYLFRVSPAGADELHQRGYVVYTYPARQPDASEGGEG